MIRVTVPLGDRSYPVVIGAGARHELAALLPARTRRAAVITQAHLAIDVDPGLPHQVFLIGDGERHKNLATIERLCSELAAAGFSRADCIVGVGGGLVTDVAGFTASVYHRGLPVIHVPLIVAAVWLHARNLRVGQRRAT